MYSKHNIALHLSTHVGFQETEKEKLSNYFLKSLVNGRNYIWNSLSTRGTARGILGVDFVFFFLLLPGTSEISLYLVHYCSF